MMKEMGARKSLLESLIKLMQQEEIKSIKGKKEPKAEVVVASTEEVKPEEVVEVVESEPEAEGPMDKALLAEMLGKKKPVEEEMDEDEEEC
jgi:hypothetical protein